MLHDTFVLFAFLFYIQPEVTTPVLAAHCIPGASMPASDIGARAIVLATAATCYMYVKVVLGDLGSLGSGNHLSKRATRSEKDTQCQGMLGDVAPLPRESVSSPRAPGYPYKERRRGEGTRTCHLP